MTDAAAKPDHDKDVTVYINTKPHEIDKHADLTFAEVVSLSYDGNPPTGDNFFFTVTYRKGPDSHKEGSLVAGQSVKMKDGMIFNVTTTDKS